MKILFFIFSIFLILFETTITNIPLMLIFILNLMIWHQEEWVVLGGVLAGLAIDILALKTVGVTSIFFILFTTIVLAYQSKFELQTNHFLAILTVTGSVIYLLLIGNSRNIILEILICIIASFVFFKMFEKRRKMFERQ